MPIMLSKLSPSLPRATFAARIEAIDDQRLPPLFTTALHGALGHALLDTACRSVPRCSSGECREATACRVACLSRPTSSTLDVTGAQPLVLRPAAPVTSRTPLELPRGSVLECHVLLLGQAAIDERATLARALERAVERGLGIDHDRRRARLALRSLESVAQTTTPQRGEAVDTRPRPPNATLRLRTPLRLQVDGHVRSDFDALTLRRALLRRARIVLDAFGDRSSSDARATVTALLEHLDLELRSTEATFRIVSRQTHMVHVRRYSSRQSARMEWPGVVGRLDIEGDIEADMPLFDLARELHVGKNTSFGFGQVELSAPAPVGT